jgi:ERCC4-type nuclease
VPHKLVVDVREFMSGLPAVLHTQGFKLTPITLEVCQHSVVTAPCSVLQQLLAASVEHTLSLKL